MKKINVIATILVCLGILWLPNASRAFTIVTRDMIEQQTVINTDLIRTVDNFIILFDTSSTTNGMVPGTDVSKIKAAKALLAERNAWLPDLGYNAGLYIYTTLTGTLKEVYGIKPYDRDAFATAIGQLPEEGKGPAMLQAGLHGLRKLMSGLKGKTAVIIFTDGSFTINRDTKKPVQIAQEIAASHDVDFFLISSATADTEKQLLKAVARVDAGSRVIPMATFIDHPLYLSGELFQVKTTAYTRLKPVTKVVGIIANDMLFDFGSDAIRPSYDSKLDELGAYMKQNPSAYVVAAGYTDSVGSEEYNLGLSERRVASVKAYLVDKHGIDADRIIDLWYGEINPVADNGTEDGRQANRRVEIAIGGIN